MLRKVVLFSLLIGGALLAYYLYWLRESLTLEKGSLTPELRQEYGQCDSLVDMISLKVSIPDEALTPNRKAIHCKILISFTLKKYLQITIYGILSTVDQGSIIQTVQRDPGRKMPVEVIVLEKEVLRKVDSGFERQAETTVLRKWIY